MPWVTHTINWTWLLMDRKNLIHEKTVFKTCNENKQKE